PLRDGRVRVPRPRGRDHGHRPQRRLVGSRLGLGPAVDEGDFVSAPAVAARLRLLRSAQAQIPDSLPPSAVPRLRSDPLLTYVGGAPTVIGVERSVRGIDSASGIQPLSGVWLTTVGTG